MKVHVGFNNNFIQKTKEHTNIIKIRAIGMLTIFRSALNHGLIIFY